jgi:hypothetical protein
MRSGKLQCIQAIFGSVCTTIKWFLVRPSTFGTAMERSAGAREKCVSLLTRIATGGRFSVNGRPRGGRKVICRHVAQQSGAPKLEFLIHSACWSLSGQLLN